MNHSELTIIAEGWLLKTKGCGFAFRELVTYAPEIPDAIGWRDGITILIECKANRADFLRDKNKIFRKHPWMGMGTYRYYLCPAGVIKKEDLPEKWGLIWVDEHYKARQKVGVKGNIWNSTSPFYHQEKNESGEMYMLISALRRLHLRGVIPLIYEQPWQKEQEK